MAADGSWGDMCSAEASWSPSCAAQVMAPQLKRRSRGLPMSGHAAARGVDCSLRLSVGRRLPGELGAGLASCVLPGPGFWGDRRVVPQLILWQGKQAARLGVGCASGACRPRWLLCNVHSTLGASDDEMARSMGGRGPRSGRRRSGCSLGVQASGSAPLSQLSGGAQAPGTAAKGVGQGALPAITGIWAGCICSGALLGATGLRSRLRCRVWGASCRPCSCAD